MKKKYLTNDTHVSTLLSHKHSLPFPFKRNSPFRIPNHPANLVSKVNTAEGELDFQCQALLTTFPSVFPLPGNGLKYPTLTGKSFGKGIDTQVRAGIYDPGSRFATTPPPPPPMVWSQNLRFAAFCMKTWYLQCFLHGGWLARSANLQILRISCKRPSENVLFAMFRLRHRGVVPFHPLLCQIII